MLPPRPEERPQVFENHGTRRVDPFYWMKDRENPEVIAHLKAENAYTESVLAPSKALRAKVLEEMKARLAPSDESYPFLLRGYYYYRRFEPGKEYPVFARRKGVMTAPEEILLDVNVLSVGHDYTEVHFPEVSPDSTKIIYAADFVGRRFFDLYVKDLTTGQIVGTPVEKTTGNAEWANDSRTFFYAKQDPDTLRARWIHRHEVGSPSSELVFEESDDTFDVAVGKSRTDTFLYFVSSATLSSEWRVLRADDPLGTAQVFLAREERHEYSLEDGGDAFYIVTNWRAQNFRLMKAPHAPVEKGAWQEVVPHRADTLLEGVSFFRSHYVLSERRNGQACLTVVNRAGGSRAEIEFPDPVYVAGVDVNPEYDSHFVRYRYESLNLPASLFDYDFATAAAHWRKTQNVPTFDAGQYVSDRIWAKARDGTAVPISLVHRRDFEKDGKAPVFLYAYGSYGLSMEPWFQSDIISLLDRGFVYAIAHVRGGSEMGRAWYDNGKLLRKMNTFTDFIDCTEFLVAQKYGDRVYASGASAGGLLMGTVANLRPELFRGILAGVPFVDVLTTMLDESIPLTTSEYDEWGDPREPGAFRCMAEYSPYDNVRAQAYPAMLITAGLHDSQVQYWEPAKWAAKLRKLGTGSAPVLLHTEMEAGHGGASGRFHALEQTALEFSFILQLEGQL
ncbi:MAG: S9 family peptidase [Bdellovibrionota bacterium]